MANTWGLKQPHNFGDNLSDPRNATTRWSNTLGGLGGQSTDAGFGAQQKALGMYAAAARGQGTSVAEQQLRAQSDQNIAAQAAMAARGRGGNIAGMQQQAMAQGAGMQATTNQQAAMLRAQEQQAAMAGYAGLASQMQGQGLEAYGMAQQGDLGAGQQFIDWQQGNRELELMERQQQYERNMGWAKLGIGAGLGLMEGIGSAISDPRLKENVAPGGLAATQAVGELAAVQFDYDPSVGIPGRQTGVMATDLERTPAGAQIVHDTPYGKTVDIGGATMLNLAASADQEQRLRELESMVGGTPATQSRADNLGPSANNDERMAMVRRSVMSDPFALGSSPDEPIGAGLKPQEDIVAETGLGGSGGGAGGLGQGFKRFAKGFGRGMGSMGGF